MSWGTASGSLSLSFYFTLCHQSFYDKESTWTLHITTAALDVWKKSCNMFLTLGNLFDPLIKVNVATLLFLTAYKRKTEAAASSRWCTPDMKAVELSTQAACFTWINNKTHFKRIRLSCSEWVKHLLEEKPNYLYACSWKKTWGRCMCCDKVLQGEMKLNVFMPRKKMHAYRVLFNLIKKYSLLV